MFLGVPQSIESKTFCDLVGVAIAFGSHGTLIPLLGFHSGVAVSKL
jgi:hypothetical protein